MKIFFTEFGDQFVFTTCLNPKGTSRREREIGADNKDKDELIQPKFV